MLLRQIIPRIASAIPMAVSYVGSEDTQELIQDGTAMAAKILTTANKNGKKVTPANVASGARRDVKFGPGNFERISTADEREWEAPDQLGTEFNYG